MISVRGSTWALEHPSGLTDFSSSPYYALPNGFSSRKVQGSSRSEGKLTGKSWIACRQAGKCGVVSCFLTTGVGLTLVLSTVLACSFIKQNSDNYCNDNYPVKLPFISKAQVWRLSAKLLLKLTGKTNVHLRVVWLKISSQKRYYHPEVLLLCKYCFYGFCFNAATGLSHYSLSPRQTVHQTENCLTNSYK